MFVGKVTTTHKEELGMTHFLMFYAPFIVLVGALVVAFAVAPMDGSVRKEK